MAHIPHPTQRTQVMGILNVTDDSFSDGGLYATTAAAVAHAETLVAAGADIIDVGGESTRPGAVRVPEEIERQRVSAVITELTARGIATSVDTMRASTAAAAVAAGASIINDVSGGLADSDMLSLAADTGVDICLMHWNKTWNVRGVASGKKKDSQDISAAGYHDHGDIIHDVRAWLAERISAAEHAGVQRDRIIVDPGIGFAKSPRDNWLLLQAMSAKGTHCVDPDIRVLIGVSRKRFLTALRPDSQGNPGLPSSADDATAAVSAIAASHAAWAVRVHNVAPTRAAVDVAWCIARGNGPEVDEEWRAQRG